MLKSIRYAVAAWLSAALLLTACPALALGLAEIRDSGVIRYQGIAYTHFVSGSRDGRDVEPILGIAAHPGLRNGFVPDTWTTVPGDLTGQHAKRNGTRGERYGNTPMHGNIRVTRARLDGTCEAMVRNYHPAGFDDLPEFFDGRQ